MNASASDEFLALLGAEGGSVGEGNVVGTEKVVTLALFNPALRA